MYLQKLRGKVALGVFELNNDREFHEILSNDKVLDDLDEQKIDYMLEKEMCLASLGHQLEYKGFKFNHIRPWHIAMLWTEQSPLLNKFTEAKMEDFDYFFWLLNADKSECRDKIKSRHFTILHYGEIIEEISIVLLKLFKVAFYPLSFMPKMKNVEVASNSGPCYDFDWLVHTCYDKGMKFDDALDEPLCVLTSMFVQQAKGNPQLHIGRTPPQEILKQQDYRVCELVAQRLIDKGILDESKREEFIATITTKPE